MSLPYSLRRGTSADSYAVFVLLEETLYDLLTRSGQTPPDRYDTPEKLAHIWRKRRALYEHLARHADQFWIAEQEGEVIGYARSIVHGGVRELTEFFVKPGVQSQGVGAALFAKAFPMDGTLRGSIIATLDVRAQSRYLQAGMQHQFLILYLGKAPELQPEDPALRALPLEDSPETHLLLDRIDQQVLGFSRLDTHEYLLRDRSAFVYLKPGGEPLGYGYVGPSSGPFALIDPALFPQVLAHAEAEAVRQGLAQFGVEVPAVNRSAIQALLGRGFRIDPFMAAYMSSHPLARPDGYILTGPPLVL